ncbi:MAG: alpha amylase, catalytic region [Rhodospirillales bacterium]|nr:alpha amylase, catalytic region [Rhodospirillales bacterium]
MNSMPWWQSTIIYQIYPRSFQDSDGDGVGDLLGIIERLPYLVELGIETIWLSPIFPSPMADFGYDISDYVNIDPLFGTLDDLDRLIADAHAHGIKVILDLVPNHTSIEHPWFVESRSSRTNPKRDWYIWRDPAPSGGVPNNWLSEFGGSGWQLDWLTGQYYYHTFLAAQPDLNWRNPDVRAAIYDAMRFWFRRGIDGFRVDAVWYVIKDEQFRDNPINPDYKPTSPPNHALIPLYTADRPEMQEVIAEMRRVSDGFSDRLLIGELYLPIERLVAYYGRDLSGVHLPFNFTLLTASWRAEVLADLIREYNEALPPGGWPNWVLGNHDRPRIASRIGEEQVRIAAMLLLTLHGTPTVYYGDEIGLKQAQIRPDRIRDPVELNVPGYALGRDGCRTPMHWDASDHAGFSITESWLPIGKDYRERNVARQRSDANSLFQFYRTLIALRRGSQVLIRGALHSIRAEGDILTFLREHEQERIAVALNLSAEPATVSRMLDESDTCILLSSFSERRAEILAHSIELGPNEGIILGRRK